MYDISTASNQIIIDNLHKQVKLNFMTMISLVGYDPVKNILTIRKSGGDAGFASGALYELNLNTNKFTETISAGGMVYCGENRDCTPEDKIEQEKLDKIFNEPKLDCNGVNIITSYNQVVVSGGFEKTFEDTYYIGCMTQ